jgi:Glycine-zipper domain
MTRHQCLLTLAAGLASVAVSAVAAPPASAQNIIAYPERGQTQEQQQRDRFDCYQWAVSQTGFNPQQQAYAPPPSAAPQQGQVLRGAGRGAALGAVGGAIGGDAGKGAAIGAGVGGLFGAMRRRDATMQQEQMQSQQYAATSQQMGMFNRAMGACMRGRGYSVD